LALAGMARLLGGDVEGGGRDIERVWALWPQDYGMFRSDRDRAFAWLSAERDGLPAAREILLTAAADARARGAFALEAMLLHDVVRFGGAAAVAERLVALSASVQGGLMVARADHAVGVATADVGRLREAGTAFEWAGSPLLAAEVALEMGILSTSRSDDAGAHAAIDRARRLLQRLDGPAATPLLRERLPNDALGLDLPRSAEISNP
jgi:hypothetical protein